MKIYVRVSTGRHRQDRQEVLFPRSLANVSSPQESGRLGKQMQEPRPDIGYLTHLSFSCGTRSRWDAPGRSGQSPCGSSPVVVVVLVETILRLSSSFLPSLAVIFLLCEPAIDLHHAAKRRHTMPGRTNARQISPTVQTIGIVRMDNTYARARNLPCLLAKIQCLTVGACQSGRLCILVPLDAATT